MSNIVTYLKAKEKIEDAMMTMNKVVYNLKYNEFYVKKAKYASEKLRELLKELAPKEPND